MARVKFDDDDYEEIGKWLDDDEYYEEMMDEFCDDHGREPHSSHEFTE